MTGPIAVGAWVNLTPCASRSSCSAATSSTANEVYGMPSSTRACLNTFAAGCASGSSSSSTPSGSFGPTTVSQRNSPTGTSVLARKPSFAFCWSSTSTLVTLILGMDFSLDGPAFENRAQRFGIQMVDLGSSLAVRTDQAGILQDGQMLGDRLTRRGAAVSHHQARADLEQGLPVTECELVEDRPSRRVGQRLVQVTHEAKSSATPAPATCIHQIVHGSFASASYRCATPAGMTSA